MILKWFPLSIVLDHRRTSRGARGVAAPPVTEIFEIFGQNAGDSG